MPESQLISTSQPQARATAGSTSSIPAVKLQLQVPGPCLARVHEASAGQGPQSALRNRTRTYEQPDRSTKGLQAEDDFPCG